MATQTIARPTDESQPASQQESARTPDATPPQPDSRPPQPPHERIAERAYRRFEARGRSDGLDLQDWLDAERELEELLSDRE
jgi:hypothetical protein